MSDDRKFFIFIGGRDYHPNSPRFSPVRGQPYIIVTLESYHGRWSASGEVRFDVPNSEILPDVLTSSSTDLEKDLRGYFVGRVKEEDIALMEKAIYSVLVNLVIDAVIKKPQDTEVTEAVS